MIDSNFDSCYWPLNNNIAILIANGVHWNISSTVHSENRIKFTMYHDQHKHKKQNSHPDRLLGNKVCSVGRIATVTAGVSLPLATVFVTTTVGTGVLRLNVLSSISSSSNLVKFEVHLHS